MPVDNAFCFTVFIWKGLKLSTDRLKIKCHSSSGPGKKGQSEASHKPENTLENQMSGIAAAGLTVEAD